MTKLERARELRADTARHYNCCQSVVLPFAEELGLDEEAVLKLAEHFGSGMRRGSVCGAVTGGLMALGLTTGVLASVFNLLGAMFGKSVMGAIMLILIFLLGHAVNLGINALGAYVHTIRLQYVELFSKFYEGGGRMFRPFAFRSKYIRIREEKQV